jgi:NADPH-dependent glutamate synthase beta subunit-like oxidoreductase
VPVDERCCLKFGRCELRKVAEYIGIEEDTAKYLPGQAPALKEGPLFDRDYNLCIGCLKCVRVCKDVRGVETLDFVWDDGEVIVGTTQPSLKESGCRFCGACVEVCPAGGLLDKGIQWAEREKKLIPCRDACPLGIDVPRYVRLVREERFDEALAVIREKTPFPSVLGEVCHHPCEVECRRSELNDPIAICALKRFVSENSFAPFPGFHAPSTGKRVAIVGSGPAGLTAAHDLSKLGHSVTIFESLDKPGGMLWSAIPRYRLSERTLKRDIDQILKQDIDLKLSTSVCEDLTINELKSQGYEAIFLATGAGLSKRLNLDGAELDGVLWGLDFLRDANLGRQTRVTGRVVVVGGGNVSIDAALTTVRLGAVETQVFCLESRDKMPAYDWEIDQAVDEGILLNCSWGPKAILGENGKVREIELVGCTSVFDEEGIFNPSFDESKTKSAACDTVILAIGQMLDHSFFDEASGIGLTEEGTVKVGASLETSVDGVFAGGDLITGPASVVEAVAAGKKAAMSIDRYLGGAGSIEEEPIETEMPKLWCGRDEAFADLPRIQIPVLPLDKRGEVFSQVDLGFDKDMAVAEANRCLGCDIRFFLSPVAFPPEKWLDFNSENVDKVPGENGVFQLLSKEKDIIYIKGTIDMHQELEEQLAANEKARYFTYEEEPMYTKRESELIQRYLQEHGKMPEGNEELDDLF